LFVRSGSSRKPWLVWKRSVSGETQPKPAPAQGPRETAKTDGANRFGSCGKCWGRNGPKQPAEKGASPPHQQSPPPPPPQKSDLFPRCQPTAFGRLELVYVTSSRGSQFSRVGSTVTNADPAVLSFSDYDRIHTRSASNPVKKKTMATAELGLPTSSPGPSLLDFTSAVIVSTGAAKAGVQDRFAGAPTRLNRTANQKTGLRTMDTLCSKFSTFEARFTEIGAASSVLGKFKSRNWTRQFAC